jgi:hypothetical protein
MEISSIALSRSVNGTDATLCTFTVDQASPSDSYILRGVTGLDADELTPQLHSTGFYTGKRFFHVKPKAREITMRVILNPNPNPPSGIPETASELRNKLYTLISSYRTSQIRLDFIGFEARVFIEGFITKFESSLDSQISEVTITVRCDYPYFRTPERFGMTTDVLNSLSKTRPVVVNGFSNAPHGFRLRLMATATFTYFLIGSPTQYDWYFEISGFSFQTGDILSICSEEDNKFVVRERTGTVNTNLIRYVSPQSEWPLLFPGVNSDFEITGGLLFDYVEFSYYGTLWGL